MAWPFTPLTTYVANSVPAIKASDLNDLQAQDNNAALALWHKDFSIAEDFTGTAISDSLWDLQVADIAIVDDSANGASGAVELNTTNNTYFRTTALGSIGTADFRYYARLRWVTKTTALAIVGLWNPTGPVYRAAFTAGSAQTNWQASCGATSVDTGVAAVNATYKDFYIQRDAGEVTFYIDDALVATISYATSFTDAKAGVFTSGTASDMFVDACKVNTPR
jgi:hypothetical protein